MKKQKSKKKTEFNKVTPFSKTIALFLFIALPIVAFWFGYTRGTEVQDAVCRATHEAISYR